MGVNVRLLQIGSETLFLPSREDDSTYGVKKTR